MVIVVLVAAAVITFGRRKPPQKTAIAESRGSRFNVPELARRLKMSEADLRDAEPVYRVATINKSSGGVRTLEIPDDGTKYIQRRILRRLLTALRAHPLACGFEQHTSIVDAALPHEGQSVVVKLDIRRFFESTSADRVQQYFEGIGWETEAAALLTSLTTYNGHLPQGAPTSPRLSNLLNAPLDEAMLRLARHHRGVYTRYADDITLSFPKIRGRVVRGIIQAVRRILRCYGYRMHGGDKLKILRQHQCQKVLGLVVNDRVALPRSRRRWLRAVRHHRRTGRNATLSDEQLRGWEALEEMVRRQREE